MPWPAWLSWRQSSPSNSEDANDATQPNNRLPNSTSPPRRDWQTSLHHPDWSRFTTPETLITSVLLTTLTLSALKLHRIYLRRIPKATTLPDTYLHTRSIFGYVTSVGDGDNMRVFHTPGGRILGWGFSFWRRRHVQDFKRDRLANNTIHVRLAGIDAPELAHFGRPEQPYGKAALEGLRELALGRWVRVYPYRKDQYERVVGLVLVRRWWGLGRSRDVGLEMLRRGHATVYEAKFGSEFGGKEQVYREAEAVAKSKNVGLWAHEKEPGFLAKLFGAKKREELETPREYKQRMEALDRAEAAAKKDKA